MKKESSSALSPPRFLANKETQSGQEFCLTVQELHKSFMTARKLGAVVVKQAHTT